MAESHLPFLSAQLPMPSGLPGLLMSLLVNGAFIIADADRADPIHEVGFVQIDQDRVDEYLVVVTTGTFPLDTS